MCVTAQCWEHPLLNDTQCSPRQSPASSCNIPANSTSIRGAAGGIRQRDQIREGHGVEGLGSPAMCPSAFLFATSLKSHLVFQLAEAIQCVRMMLCDAASVVLTTAGLCCQGNAVWFFQCYGKGEKRRRMVAV